MRFEMDGAMSRTVLSFDETWRTEGADGCLCQVGQPGLEEVGTELRVVTRTASNSVIDHKPVNSLKFSDLWFDSRIFMADFDTTKIRGSYPSISSDFLAAFGLEKCFDLSAFSSENSRTREAIDELIFAGEAFIRLALVRLAIITPRATVYDCSTWIYNVFKCNELERAYSDKFPSRIKGSVPHGRERDAVLAIIGYVALQRPTKALDCLISLVPYFAGLPLAEYVSVLFEGPCIKHQQAPEEFSGDMKLLFTFYADAFHRLLYVQLCAVGYRVVQDYNRYSGFLEFNEFCSDELSYGHGKEGTDCRFLFGYDACAYPAYAAEVWFDGWSLGDSY